MAWPCLTSQELQFSILYLLFLIFYLFCNHYFRSSRKNTSKSCLPTNWPIFGMFPSLLANRHGIFGWVTSILHSARGNFFFYGPWFSGMTYFVTSDPANIKYMFSDKFPEYPKGDDFDEIFGDIAGDGIFNAEGDMWKYQRAKSQTLMFHSNFKDFTARLGREKLMNFILPFLTDAASRGITIDAHEMFLKLTFDMSTIITMGVDPNNVSTDIPIGPFMEAVDLITPSLFSRIVTIMAWWKLLRRLGISQEKKMAKVIRVIDAFMAKVIEKRREDMTKGEEASPNFLSSYMDNNEGEITDKFLRDAVMSLFVAARDSTASALSWLLWSMIQNPHMQEKILSELNSIPKRFTPDGMVVFEEEELAKLVYFQATVLESLRLYPPVPFNFKGVEKSAVLPSGHQLTPGVNVILCMYAMGRMEAVWGKDCAEFKPERWISDSGKLKYEPSHKFITFHTGPRTCLGKDMSLRFIRTVAAAILYNFCFEVIDGHVVEPQVSIILQMKNGLMVKVKKRGNI
ncbi:hypothetical protein LUZ60_014975 [Juncus effusus]|nr:hypothetical protein LUZ60_014975 [Juncus effusus]